MAGTLITQNIQGPSSGANANKILIPSGQTLDVSGGTFTPSAGQVVQIVHNTTNSNQITSSTSFVASYLTGSITPTSTDSKILIIMSTGIDTNNNNNTQQVTIYRDNTTNLGTGSSNYFAYGWGVNSRLIVPCTITFVDSPATTSSTTYTCYFKSGGSYQTESPGTLQKQQITLMEIAQ